VGLRGQAEVEAQVFAKLRKCFDTKKGSGAEHSD
jgi:hypothetical protein